MNDAMKQLAGASASAGIPRLQHFERYVQQVRYFCATCG